MQAYAYAIPTVGLISDNGRSKKLITSLQWTSVMLWIALKLAYGYNT